MESDKLEGDAINQKYAVVMIPPRTTVRLELYQVTDFHLQPLCLPVAKSTCLLHRSVRVVSERERLGIHPPMLVGYQILLT